MSSVNGWLLAKYALTLVGLGLVLAADRFGRTWLGYVGLALIVLAGAWLGCAPSGPDYPLRPGGTPSWRGGPPEAWARRWRHGRGDASGIRMRR